MSSVLDRVRQLEDSPSKSAQEPESVTTDQQQQEGGQEQIKTEGDDDGNNQVEQVEEQRKEAEFGGQGSSEVEGSTKPTTSTTDELASRSLLGSDQVGKLTDSRSFVSAGHLVHVGRYPQSTCSARLGSSTRRHPRPRLTHPLPDRRPSPTNLPPHGPIHRAQHQAHPGARTCLGPRGQLGS